MPQLTTAWLDAILVGVAVEGLVLAAWLARRGARHWILPAALFLGSGAALLLALRSALTLPSSPAVPAALSLAGVAHVASLVAAQSARRRDLE